MGRTAHGHRSTGDWTCSSSVNFWETAVDAVIDQLVRAENAGRVGAGQRDATVAARPLVHLRVDGRDDVTGLRLNLQCVRQRQPFVVYRVVELDAFDCARLFVTIRAKEPAGFFGRIDRHPLDVPAVNG